MSIRSALEINILGYERIVEFTSTEGFQCYIALHSIKLGPAFGGCRVMKYNCKGDALRDVMNLAKGMTYKNSLAGLNYGGGKCVVVAEKATPEIMEFVGDCVEFMNGTYITGEDIGTNSKSIEIVRMRTKWADSPPPDGKDLSTWTSLGVYHSILSAITYCYGPTSRSMGGNIILVEGLGKVGMGLVELLSNSTRMSIFVKDIDKSRVQLAMDNFEAEEYDNQLVDVYSPCAVGGMVNYKNLSHKDDPFAFCNIICGSANNQLENDSYAKILDAQGILYCPDYLVNSGGVIAAAYNFEHKYDPENLTGTILGIGDRLTELLNLDEIPLHAANRMAELRLK